MVDTTLALAISTALFSIWQQYKIENICKTCPFTPRNQAEKQVAMHDTPPEKNNF